MSAGEEAAGVSAETAPALKAGQPDVDRKSQVMPCAPPDSDDCSGRLCWLFDRTCLLRSAATTSTAVQAIRLKRHRDIPDERTAGLFDHPVDGAGGTGLMNDQLVPVPSGTSELIAANTTCFRRTTPGPGSSGVQ